MTILTHGEGTKFIVITSGQGCKKTLCPETETFGFVPETRTRLSPDFFETDTSENRVRDETKIETLRDRDLFSRPYTFRAAPTSSQYNDARPPRSATMIFPDVLSPFENTIIRKRPIMKFWTKTESFLEQQYDTTMVVDFPTSNGSPAT
jgi:hypothetical protein